MIIVLKNDLKEENRKTLRRFLVDLRVEAVPVTTITQSLLVVVGKCGELTREEIRKHSSVARLIDVDRPYKLASISSLKTKTKFKLGENITIGNKKIVIMAGPCSVESKEQILNTAGEIKKTGAHILRGGAYKPRTAPYDFQGLGKIGLRFLKDAADKNNMPVITEVMDIRDIDTIERYTDVFQVGTRNMQNYPLLKELGKQKKPVLLKRGMWSTYKELLLAAEYILVGGNENVILCERGIRTHVPETRFTLDLNAVPYLKHETHLPVFVDPSHGTGRASLVRAMSRAAVAAGCDGLLIEAHLDPRRSVSDADQAISMVELAKLIKEVRLVAKAVDRI
ncbi:MAG: phospho-2-dehydro-3-deoxyheptonate aldolase, 3-deoxy-7-phosphoheptulonate synthase [Candidatus Gottesmanbacteria bacterium GW2011_GWA2_43_14]|uniref:Phospho-2-dehydro-3-deoxyheptonate aldolase, 3-deoxy-7-phosphoheptulonate synthase n=1 Tax=Candidatus Gottesmanbacteria bacterium GW2011_GWA2_43_14 TaxID=1618443 RepID=A0A0G1DL43_9BACT|nr:MAG: phospho-2-dehydro-3-deoxyheptonate aldolase, 3-deoxy-7-phosphoheptulonate synthase [Candidatus Gottesmanbacteria bacterium GW2011_GWA2_43_14]